jgi:hypothetical protein
MISGGNMRIFLSLLLCLGVGFPACSFAQAPITTPVPTTRVLAIGTVVGERNAALRDTMPSEVRDTVSLYLDGKLDQWFVRQDGKGVVFLLNATSVEDAQAMLSKLPLVQAKRMEFQLMPLGPLSPLRYLMGAPGGATKP